MAATLGQLIRERRMDMNLTQEELAERVGPGVRQSEISRLERNRVTLPRRQRLEQIAHALDIPVGVLLARSGWTGAEGIEFNATEPEEGSVGEPARPAEVPGELSSAGAAILALPGGTGSNGANASVEAAGDAGDVSSRYDNDDWDRNDSWSQAEGESLRDTVSRTESMISQSRSRIRDVESTMVRGRESVRRGQPTDPK
ncbi:MAG: helix-turn-helix transcriptional regulator [Chloroflexia bacterium]|nr:helix-turn-helix transcriptional regulator [Chloroflexia bacterium]